MVTMKCQLDALSREVARELTFEERFSRRWNIIRRRTTEILRKATSIKALAGKAKTVVHLQQLSSSTQTGGAQTGGVEDVQTSQDSARSVAFPPLGLQPNERVRVKSLEEIRKTLDATGRCEGCGFTAAMPQYCGKTTTVLKRVDRFFDERNAKLLKAKNMVLLAEFFCHSPPDVNLAWAGCDRSCYLFWKEAWLERVEPDQPA